MAKKTPKKRDPKEPTPIVLMNPELRVRQLRYAANIEATQMVPLYRYYEVLVDLSQMGLEYLKRLNLERSFIIFKRIEYFFFHRLRDHIGYSTFTSEAKTKITGRIAMIMYVAQQIIVDFVMPVYERQAAYFRYEELQRRLKLLNPTAWQTITAEAVRREAEFYSEAEKISTMFGVELASFLPQEVIPDDNHPSNYPPRTHPVGIVRGAENTQNRTSAEDSLRQSALSEAIKAMNTSAKTMMDVSQEQTVENLVRNINEMMNKALNNFFTTRCAQAQRLSDPTNIQVDHTAQRDDDVLYLRTEMANRPQAPHSPRVGHMYELPADRSSGSSRTPPPSEVHPVVLDMEDRKRFEYNPVLSLDAYIELLTKTFKSNSSASTGYQVIQLPGSRITRSIGLGARFLGLKTVGAPDPPVANHMFVPEPDPGPPRTAPPTQPLPVPPKPNENPEKFGPWVKKGAALGPEGVGSIGVISDLHKAQEVLDSVPPMPEEGIHGVGQPLPRIPQNFYSVPTDVSPEKPAAVVDLTRSSGSSDEIDILTVDPPARKRTAGTSDESDHQAKRYSSGGPGGSGSSQAPPS